MYQRIISAFLTVLLVLVSPLALAHPHVWVYTDVKIDAENNAFNTVHLTWAFDEMYSTAFMMDADSNKNRKLDPAEVEILKNEVFGEGSELGQFMYFALDGETFTPTEFKNVNMEFSNKGQLVYTFDVMLPKSLPLSVASKISFFDPMFYVAFEQGLDLDLAGADGCSASLGEDENIRIYNGLIMPEVYTFSCKG